MRHLQGKALVVQLMVTVGLMFAFIGLANMIWDQNLSHTMPTLFGEGGFHIGRRGRSRGTASHHRGRDRARDRPAPPAVPDPPRRRDARGRRQPRPRGLGGARSELVSSFSWALGCSLAALAGILLAPETGMSTSGPLTFLIITAFAAAAVGRLRSLPLTYLGALILALAIAVVAVVPRSSAVAGPTCPPRSRRSCCSSCCCCSRRRQLQFARLSMVRRTERVSTVRDTVIGMAVVVRRDGRSSALFLSPDEPQPLRARRCAPRSSRCRSCRSPAGPVRCRSRRSRSPASARSRTRGSAARTAASARSSSPRSSSCRSARCLALPALRLQGLYLALATLVVRGDGRARVLHPAVRARTAEPAGGPPAPARDALRRHPHVPAPRDRRVRARRHRRRRARDAARSGAGSSRSATARPRR